MVDVASGTPFGDAEISEFDGYGSPRDPVFGAARSNLGYAAAKRLFDLAGALALLPLFLLTALVLLLLNPPLNRGQLFFLQDRMGQHGRRFRVWKFRSMVAETTISRGPYEPLDSHRITRLGNVLRRTRLDEVPQIINVLLGEMSLIGPRPDYYPHACAYAEQVPGYRDRHAIRPGISGLAQVEVGYVDGLEGVRRKVSADLHYLRSASLRLDLWISWRTILTILRRMGA